MFKPFFIASCITLLILTFTSCLFEEEKAPPNIILVVFDTLPANLISVENQYSKEESYLSKLKKRSVHFSDFYAGNIDPVTSLYSLLVGKHSGNTIIRGSPRNNTNSNDFKNAEIPLTEKFKEAGYEAGFFGDLTFNPKELISSVKTSSELIQRNRETAISKETTKTLNFIDQNQGNPFFAFLTLSGFSSTGALLFEQEVKSIKEKLVELEIDRNTILFLTAMSTSSTNGDEAVNVDKKEHSWLSESNLKVPLLVNAPTKIRGNIQIDKPFAFWDFMNTVCDYALVNAPEGCNGVSMKWSLNGRRQAPQHYALYWEFSSEEHQRYEQAIRMGGWKLIRIKERENTFVELYYLKDDPEEKINLAMEHPEKVNSMIDVMYFHSQPPKDKKYPNFREIMK